MVEGFSYLRNCQIEAAHFENCFEASKMLAEKRGAASLKQFFSFSTVLASRRLLPDWWPVIQVHRYATGFETGFGSRPG